MARADFYETRAINEQPFPFKVFIQYSDGHTVNVAAFLMKADAIAYVHAFNSKEEA